MPSGTPQTWCRRSMRGEGRDAPPRNGCGRKACQLLLGHVPPASKRKSRNARGLGRELQTAGCGEAEACHLANHSGKPPLPQAFLHDGQHLALAKGLGVNHAVGMQAHSHQARSEQITAVEAPEHGPFEPRGNAGNEEGCSTREFGRRTSLDHLVQGPEGKASLRKTLIDSSNGEGQRATPVPPSFQALDPVPQIGKRRLLPGPHAPCPTCPSFQDVPIMFSFASESN